ncbi:hypothetical protein L2520_03690 [Limosilactobacillus vaginalis]|uniref:Uncharacterized protein n=1 Tax=Limosilactobacillus vaginalis TaxID=1633 RepID=A0ABT4K6X0_9LACO|nr:hypothetical protein [Limosilactobacillus vaginalis]MCZ3746525.1 hypothetical protein [Limosilactobacillus vaginalis]MCZ3751583.1 hypothetical protein [Limosilactobacillus vaginalis]MCZ3753269.1 hypothetical protein [Limosilactobacillus vaginalis]MCZ3755045.1 hypothetical protein [Limosilactobacillus vaginalis]MCZ3756755.1 hypothetical protein [Limosilactobacillus vaginalis]
MKKTFILTVTALSLLSTGVTNIIINQPTVAQASSKKYKAVNKDLKKELKKDRSYADDDPTNYGYAKYIESIKYTGGTNITVQVNGAFKDVDDDIKDDVMDHVQGLAKMVLLNDGKISGDDAREGLIILINNGKNSIGTSKALNHKKYSWN